MKVELLSANEQKELEMARDVEKDIHGFCIASVNFFAERLIEEREKNARLEALRALDQSAAELVEAELAEARKDSERLDWLFKVGDAAQHNRAAIDAAMKEGK